MLEDVVSETEAIASFTGEIRSLKAIAALPEAERDAWVRRYLPNRLLKRFKIDRETFLNPLGERVVQHAGSPQSGEVRITVWRRLSDRDPVALAEATDTSTGAIELSFLTTADPDAPRFDIDVDTDGQPTLLGTARRNLDAEAAALAAGLSPGQVRQGLALVLKDILPSVERFLQDIGHDLLFAYPLGYHNAILMERWGFDYLYGRTFMEELDRRFAPDGDLFARLDGSTPFRQPELAQTARGRSWAIHDGLLDASFEAVKLVKRVGRHARVRTFKGPY